MQIRSCTYTLSHGITPGVAELECVPQPKLPPGAGTLVFTINGQPILSLPDCQVNVLSARRNAQGLIWSFQILDRRWKWQAGGAISGVYNVRNDDETLDMDTEKTPQQLATLLLTEMKEQGFDVSELPNESRPLVSWAGDNPAQMLVELVDKLGCHVVWRLDNKVKICRLGVGEELPESPDKCEDSGAYDPPTIPDALRAQFGPTKIQAVVSLEAIGLDLDKKIKPIDELSYKPATGWGREVPGQFYGVPDVDPLRAGDPSNNPRLLALRTVFKWYRVYDLLGNFEQTASVLGPGWTNQVGQYNLDDIKQILPLFPAINDIDPLTGEGRKPFVQGVFATQNIWDNSPAWTEYKQPFNVVSERGIVEFDQYTYKWKTPGVAPAIGADAYKPAEVYIVCAFPLKRMDTRATHRYTQEIQLNNPPVGTGPRVIKQEELSLMIACRYNMAGNITSIDKNTVEMDKEAEYQLKAVLSAFQVKSPRTKKYVGLKLINPDGKIQQVSWSVAQGVGAFTTASSDSEFSVNTMSYADRRTIERARYDRTGAMVREMQRQQQLQNNRRWW